MAHEKTQQVPVDAKLMRRGDKEFLKERKRENEPR